MKQVNKEVFVNKESLFPVSKSEIEFLKGRVHQTERKRIRLCAHRGKDEKLHEMFIVLSRKTYIRPHKHLNKPESLHVIRGSADAVFFDKSGKIIRVIPLGDYRSGKKFYYRIEEPAYHTLLIHSDVFIFHETTRGPYRQSDTLYAPWSPEESDLNARMQFVKQLFVSLRNKKK